jgi:membrane-associated phospholipid phosphatase
VATAGDQDAAADRGDGPCGPRHHDPPPRGRPSAESEAILTADEEVRLADQPHGPGSGAEPDPGPPADPPEDPPAENAGQADLAPGSATEGAGLADLPRLTPAHAPVPPAVAAGLAVAAGVAFALLAVWVASRGTSVPAVDEQLRRWALAHRGPASIAVARAARWCGTTYIVLPALIVIGAAAAPRGRGLARRLASGLLPALVASTGVYAEIWINHIIGRARPPVADWAGAAGGASFPSGHTTAAALFALGCAWAIAGRVRPGWPRGAVWAGAGAYALVVGWSRVWLGVHWPGDVTAGWLFSAAWTAGCIAAITWPARRSGAGSGQSRPRSLSRQGRPSGS